MVAGKLRQVRCGGRCVGRGVHDRLSCSQAKGVGGRWRSKGTVGYAAVNGVFRITIVNLGQRRAGCTAAHDLGTEVNFKGKV